MAEASVLWPPDVNNWLIGKDPSAGKDWRYEEKGTTENEMAGWHHRLSGYERLNKLWEMVKDRGAWRAAVHEVTKSQTQPSNWTTAPGCFQAWLILPSQSLYCWGSLKPRRVINVKSSASDGSWTLAYTSWHSVLCSNTNCLYTYLWVITDAQRKFISALYPQGSTLF